MNGDGRVLRARGLRFAYPDGTAALGGVDFDVGAGELVCLLGPNGSGKTTLLKVLGGLLVPQAGDVLMRGAPIGRLSPRERARTIASVPQSVRALPEVRVEDFVLGGRYPYLGAFGRPRPGDREAVSRALAEAHASEFRGRLVRELSGGQWQRVLVARALAQEADVLLFDEPTASLDPRHQVLVFDLIARLVERGRTAVIATHELNLASRYASGLVVLDGGRIHARGAVAEILRPEILEPVYGPDLCFRRGPGAAGRPLVVPWPAADGRSLRGSYHAASMSATSTPVGAEHFAYVAERTRPEDPLLRELKEASRAAGVPPIWISHEQAVLMRILLAAAGARTVVEVGTLTGYSAISMARALPPAGEGGRLVTIEIEPRYADMAEAWIARSDVADRVEVRRGDAREVLPTLPDRSADAAFLDADKGGYGDYLDQCLRIVRPGGLVLVDNAFAFGRLFDEAPDDPDVEHVRAFNDRMARTPGLLGTIVPIGDGLWVAVVEG